MLKSGSSKWIFLQQRLLFQQKKSEEKQPGGAEGVEAEKQEGKPSDREALVADLRERVARLKENIEDMKKRSANPAVVELAQKALLDLGQMTRDKNVSREKIDRKGAEISELLEYLGIVSEYEKNRTFIAEVLKSNASEVRKKYAADFEQSCKENPKLSEELKARLLNGNRLCVQKLVAAYETEYLPKGQISLAKFRKNPEEIRSLADQAAGSRKTLEGGEVPPTGDTARIEADYGMERDSILLVSIGKDGKESEDYLEQVAGDQLKTLQDEQKRIENSLEENPDQEELKGQLLSVMEKTGKISYLVENALANLRSVGNAKLRSVIVANFLDDVEKVYVLGPIESTHLDKVMDMTGLKKDDIAKGFGGLLEGKEDSTVKENNGKYLYIKYKSDFRMEGAGIAIGKAGIFTRCQVVDGQVYEVTDSKGEKVAYVKVLFNPPDGPIGYVRKEDVDFPAPKGQQPVSGAKTEAKAPTAEQRANQAEMAMQLRFDELEQRNDQLWAQHEELWQRKIHELSDKYAAEHPEMQEYRGTMLYAKKVRKLAEQDPEIKALDEELDNVADEYEGLAQRLGYRQAEGEEGEEQANTSKGIANNLVMKLFEKGTEENTSQGVPTDDNEKPIEATKKDEE